MTHEEESQIKGTYKKQRFSTIWPSVTNNFNYFLPACKNCPSLYTFIDVRLFVGSLSFAFMDTAVLIYRE